MELKPVLLTYASPWLGNFCKEKLLNVFLYLIYWHGKNELDCETLYKQSWSLIPNEINL